MCAHGYVCLDTHMGRGGRSKDKFVKPGFFFLFYRGSGIELQSLDLQDNKRCLLSHSPAYTFTFLFRTLHLRILE